MPRDCEAVPEQAAGFTIDEATDDAAIARLAALPVLDYERIRTEEADRLKVRASILDKLVEGARRKATSASPLQGRPLSLPQPEPWPEAVAGGALLDALASFFARHASLPPHGKHALALWALHTHCFECGRHTPRLAITSAEKGSGKTTILDLLELVCARPLQAANLTAAAIFRTIELAKPTLLIDEADLFLAAAEDVRAILNAGNKRGGNVVRCIGDDSEPRCFNVHGPVAVAAIGRLPDTLTDRSIRLPMRRATTAEKPDLITEATGRQGSILARQCVRWAADNRAALPNEPAMPESLANRAADNWRILFAIAECAGGVWPRHVLEAAEGSGGEGEDSLGVALLRDVRAIFAEARATRLPTAELVRRLIELEDRPWPEMPGSGKAITATRFTRIVSNYGAKRLRFFEDGKAGPWGYEEAGFADAFARYLSAPDLETGNTGKVEASTANFPKVKVGSEGQPSQFDFPENRANSTPFPVFPVLPGSEEHSRRSPAPNGGWEGDL